MDNKTIMTANTAFTIAKNNIPALPHFISNYLQDEISKASKAGKFMCNISIPRLPDYDITLYTRILNTLELLGYEIRSSSIDEWNNSYEFTVSWRKF